MAQTNFNRYIQIVFDRAINITEAAADVKAFSLSGQQREYYGAPLEDKVWYPDTLQYAKNASGEDVRNVLLLIFPDSNENFRKSEGELTLHYDASIGSLYGATDIDMLPNSDFVFTAQNTDNFQNPIFTENIQAQATITSTIQVHAITTLRNDITAETVQAQASIVATITPKLLGEIRP